MSTIKSMVFSVYKNNTEFLTDDQLAAMIDQRRRVVNNVRFALRDEGWSFEMRNVVVGKGRTALEYRLAEQGLKRGGIICADPIIDGMDFELFHAIIDNTSYDTEVDLCNALLKLNVEGYWDFPTLSAEMSTTYKTAYHRVSTMCERYGLEKHVRGFPDAKEYRIVSGDVKKITDITKPAKPERAHPTVDPLMKLALGL